MNICSAIVFAAPEHLGEIAGALASYDGVEVHQTSPDGKLIITLEDTPNTNAIDALRQIASLSGVIATSLVYHHFDQDLTRGVDSLELSQ